MRRPTPRAASGGIARTVGAALCALVWLAPSWAAAESAVRLPLPDTFGDIDAATYDDATGARVGGALMSITRRDDGTIQIGARSGIEHSARTTVHAVLEPLEDGLSARPVLQWSESYDEHGLSLGILSIDHRRGVARCGAPESGTRETSVLQLPEHDHVVNVPLNLLFQSLVTGEQQEVDFQVLLCRFGARLIDATARVAHRPGAEGGPVEVRYQMDFGMLSTLAAPFLPKLSFWFDESEPGAWVGHRMPLFSKGPTVLVVRHGFTPENLGEPDGGGGS